ncbi:MAG: right-handed parallel beta-helix repeat-containing protein [Deltaproteobacteria bacterium]|nr:right-handed parallel beta-helix repeat-containing protein [Deltaproteobacteria bacterium]
MNSSIKNLLKEIVDENGIAEVTKVDRCIELLSKKYGAIRKEFLLLNKALEYGVVEELLNLRHKYEIEIINRIIISRLIVRMNIPEETARWIINTWAYALGILNPKSIGDINLVFPSKKITVGRSLEGEFYDSIYNAIRDVEPQGEIELLPGVHYGHFRIKKPVRIYGVANDKVIMQCDTSPVFTIVDTEGVVLENLTLEGMSRTEYDRCNIIEVVNSKVVIKNCKIIGATLSGIFVYGKKSDLRIENSVINRCLKSGLVISDDSKCVLENSIVSTCLDSSIIVRDWATLFLIHSYVVDGENTGIRLINDANLFSDSSEISYNKRSGVIISYNSCSNMKNSSIHHNIGYGIIVSDASCTTIENCQIYQNSISGIRFDRNSDVYNYNSNINDTVVKSGETIDDQGEAIKSETINDYVKNPPKVSMEEPPNTLQSIVIVTSFVLVFEIITLIVAEIFNILLEGEGVKLHPLLVAACIIGMIVGVVYIIKK